MAKSLVSCFFDSRCMYTDDGINGSTLHFYPCDTMRVQYYLLPCVCLSQVGALSKHLLHGSSCLLALRLPSSYPTVERKFEYLQQYGYFHLWNFFLNSRLRFAHFCLQQIASCSYDTCNCKHLNKSCLLEKVTCDLFVLAKHFWKKVMKQLVRLHLKRSLHGSICNNWYLY